MNSNLMMITPEAPSTRLQGNPARQLIAFLAACLLCLVALPNLATGAATPSWPLDLSRSYQVWLTNSWTGSSMAKLPRGLQTFGDIPFQIDGVFKVLGLDDARAGEWAPPQVKGIPVGRAFVHLHLLHGFDGSDRDGTPVAAVVFHYSDGAEVSVRLGAGVHARGWIPERGQVESGLADPDSRLVWSAASKDGGGGRSPAPRLYLSTFANPRPENRVERLDVLSLFAHSGLLVAAITVDEVQSTGPAVVRSRGRLERRVDHEDDDVLRRAVTVIARDAATSEVLTNAEAFLSVSTGDQRFFLDRQTADPAGRIRFSFPPSQTVSYSVWVRGPGRVPALVEKSRLKHEFLGGEHVVVLNEGVAVGGVVQTKDGKPLPNARVSLYRLRTETKRERTRMDYAEVETGTDGRWVSRSVPASAEGLEIEVSHPTHERVRYRLDSKSPGEAGWSSEDLFKQQVVASLGALPRIAGTILNTEGAPVRNAGIFSFAGDRREPRRLAASDADGAFSFIPPDPSDSVPFLIMAEGYSPSVQRLIASDSGDAKARIILPRTKLLVGNIQDQSGEPIPGVEVVLETWNDLDLLNYRGVTDARGKFYWTNASPGTLFFRLGKGSQGRINYSMNWEDGELTFSMNRPSMLSGRVLDAQTGKPIPEFSIIRGRAYNPGDLMQWQRYNVQRGRSGAFSVVLESYSSSMRSAVMIEAPGYLPVESPEYSRAGNYTNDFRMVPGRGLHGVVLLPDGKPAANTSMALVDDTDAAYLERPGQLYRSSSHADQTRTDSQGRFEFQPRLRVSHIVAVHEQGIADVFTEGFPEDGRIQLRKWGRVEGVFRLGAGLEPSQSVRLQAFNSSYYGQGRRPSAVSMGYKTLPDKDGKFAFDKVPPGEMQAVVEYKFIERRNGGPNAYSHGVVTEVKPGGTSSVVLGGGGRRVEGRVAIVAGDAEAVNWLYDVHQMTTLVPMPPGFPSLMFAPTDSPAVQQEKQREYQKKAQEFWNTPAGLAYQRAQRNYVLVFDTNGVFHADNVPPGNYQLHIAPNEVQQDYYSYRPLGTLDTQITVPEGGKENQVFDIGKLELKVRGVPKVSRVAPPFEMKKLDGTVIKSSEFAGKTVLLYFWASWADPSSDVAVIKALQEAYEEKGKLAILMVNVDSDATARDAAIKKLSLPGTLCSVGEWSQSSVVASYGVDGFPAAVVIDPAGKISSLGSRGTGIRTAVVKSIRAAAAQAKSVTE